MDRDLLSRYLAQGLSLGQIGVLASLDPSTVSYWVKKHGLIANGTKKHASRGGLTKATKEFALSPEGVTRSLERARAEARKCVLLCANCHAEVEAGAASLS